jgi:hypothetical protein
MFLLVVGKAQQLNSSKLMIQVTEIFSQHSTFKILYTSFIVFLLLWKAPWQGIGSIYLIENIYLEFLHSELQDVLLKITYFPPK